MPRSIKSRNPKVAQFSIRLTEPINAELERVSDLLGQNKGAIASIAVAIGLNAMKLAIRPQDAMKEVDLETPAARHTEALAKDMADVKAL